MQKGYSAGDKARIINEYLRSGLSPHAYSRASGVSKSTLYKWDNELKQPGAARAVRSSGSEFIEVGGALEKHYEIRIGAAIIRVPCSEPVDRLSAIIRSLS